MKKQSIQIIAWNINQRSGYYNRNIEIPCLVIAELTRQNADVVVLSEYKHCKSFEDMLNGIGYYVLTDKNPKGNEILIVVKNILLNNNMLEISQPRGKNNSWPNFLQVDMNLYGQPVTIIGIRIRTQGAFESQYNIIKEHLKTIGNNVICVGDFNAWSSRINNKYKLPDGYCILTPTIQENDPDELKSYFTEKGTNIRKYQKYKWSFVHNDGSRAPLDHIICKGFKEPVIDYSWDFRELQPSIYKNEKGNDIYNQFPPYPDHAILSVIIELQIGKQ